MFFLVRIPLPYSAAQVLKTVEGASLMDLRPFYTNVPRLFPPKLDQLMTRHQSHSSFGSSDNHKSIMSSAEHELQKKDLISSSIRGLFCLPFSLVQIHRDKVKPAVGVRSKRSVQCFVRFCGVFQSGQDCKNIAESQILNAQIRMLPPGDEKLCDRVWHRFNSVGLSNE